jgi:hypothetical protein
LKKLGKTRLTPYLFHELAAEESVRASQIDPKSVSLSPVPDAARAILKRKGRMSRSSLKATAI